MPKIKLTKNELKQQRESLKRYMRYLPTLKLKKQQLQVEIEKIHRTITNLFFQIERLERKVYAWVDVFAEEVGFEQLLKLKEIKTEAGNIAGIDIPLFVGVDFIEEPYSLMLTPFWVDRAIEVCKEQIKLKVQIVIARKQQAILEEELRITVQRVNLFEKVKIPEARESIRVINIFLGDLQTAEVVRGKIAKAKIEKKKEVSLV